MVLKKEVSQSQFIEEASQTSSSIFCFIMMEEFTRKAIGSFWIICFCEYITENPIKVWHFFVKFARFDLIDDVFSSFSYFVVYLPKIGFIVFSRPSCSSQSPLQRYHDKTSLGFGWTSQNGRRNVLHFPSPHWRQG